MAQLRRVPESLAAAVDQDPFVADEVVVGLPWSFLAWDSDLVASHRWLASLVPEGQLFPAVHPEDPVAVPVVVQAEAAAVVAFPVAAMDLLGDPPGMDLPAGLGIAVAFRRSAGLEFGTQAAY